MDKFFKSLL